MSMNHWLMVVGMHMLEGQLPNQRDRQGGYGRDDA
jgi:hypothetical protein